MFADDGDTRALLSFASKLDLSISYLQQDDRLLHFDLTPNMRRLAVKLGAREVDRRFAGKVIKGNRTHNPLKEVWGTWPGDESIEEILEALKGEKG